LFWPDGIDNGNGNWGHGELYVNGYWRPSSINSRISFSYLYWFSCRDVYDHGNGFFGLYGPRGGGINSAEFINVIGEQSGHFVQWRYGFCHVNGKWRYAIVYIFWVIDFGLSSRHVQLHGNGCEQLYCEHHDNDHSTFGLGSNGCGKHGDTM
jgi:hypothetical protein